MARIDGIRARVHGFTQFDPFEDTERHSMLGPPLHQLSFTQFDPFEDTESLSLYWKPVSVSSFTQFDPFEDTERITRAGSAGANLKFHPIRSVRGY